MLFSFVSCSPKPEPIDTNTHGISHEEGKYPVKFNFEALYASEEEWNADYDKFFDLVKDYDSYHGTLTSAQGVYNYLMEEYFGEAARIIDKLAYYADQFGLTGKSGIEIPESITNIGSAAFYECKGLTNIILPKSISNIGVLAFRDCSKNLIIETKNKYVIDYCKQNNLKYKEI